MTLRFSPVVILILSWSVPSQGFNIFPEPVQNLVGIANTIQKKQSLALSLIIGEKKGPTFGLHDLELELGTDDAKAKIPMPGANGPHPKVSSGIKELQVKTQAWFTSMTGREIVDMKEGCWEIVWKEGAPAGALICGIDVAKEAARNGAKLPAGKLYMSFPLWTREGLAAQQARRDSLLVRAQSHLDERDRQLELYKDSNNLFAKAMHYRNAWHEVDMFLLTGYREVDRMTPNPEDELELNDSLVLAKTGTLWVKEIMNNKLMGTAQLNEKKPAAVTP